MEFGENLKVTSDLAASPPVHGVGLTRLSEVLAPIGVQLRYEPPQRVTAGSCHLHDPSGPPPATGAVVLAIGLRPGSARLAGLVAQVARARGAAVAVKPYGHALEPVLELAAREGVALFAVPDVVDWDMVATMLRAAVVHEPPVLGEPADVDEDLFALADSIAAVFGASVAIEDLSQRVVGYSSLPGQRIDDVRIAGILGRRVPQSTFTAAQYQQLYRTEGVVRFPELDGEQPRAAITVRAGSAPVGSIWAIEPSDLGPDEPLSVACVRALQRGARLAAVHLMRGHDATEPLARRRRAMFDAVLSGQNLPGADLRLLADSQLLTVSAFAPSDASLSSTVAVEFARLTSRQYRVLRPRSVVSTGHDVVYVLNLFDDTESASRIARDVLSTVEASVPVEVYSAISTMFSDIAQLGAARREVDDVIGCLRSEGTTGRVATTPDVQDRLVLLACADRLASEGRYRAPGVTAMRAPGGADYWRTVVTWLERSCSVPATARALFVHENTVRYRLGRVRSLFGIDLADADTRLSVWLQMRALELTEADNQRDIRK